MSTRSINVAAILRLPDELLAQILSQLSPSTLLSLHYTCHRFASLINTSAQRLYSQGPLYTHPENTQEWGHFLAMLERDNLLHGDLVCGACLKPHHPSLFSASDRPKPPDQRRCLGYMDQKWVCPHKLWTVDEIKLLHQGQQLKLFHPALWPVDACECLKHGMYLHWLFLAVKIDKAGRIASRLNKVFPFKRHQHIRLRDPERKCYQHTECATLGRDGSNFECRWCLGDPVSDAFFTLSTSAAS